MTSWQVQEAKQRFSEVLRKTLDEGPQTVTRHGQPIAVIVDFSEYRRITGDDLKAFLLAGPQVDLEVERDRSLMRDVEL